MQTSSDRAALTSEILNDPDIDLSFMEGLELILHWMSFEITLLRKERLQAKSKRQAKWLNDTKKVYDLRKSLKDL